MSGKLPSQWKQAKVTALHKDGNVSDPGYYRPISVLGVIMKVLERIVHDQLYSYISCQSALSVFQSGFRPKHSTTTTLCEVSDDVLSNMDRGLLTGVVFLDFKKPLIRFPQIFCFQS